jgi:hypothetical protein
MSNASSLCYWVQSFTLSIFHVIILITLVFMHEKGIESWVSGATVWAPSFVWRFVWALRVGGHSFSIVLICNAPLTLFKPIKLVHSFEEIFMQLMFWRVCNQKLNLWKKEKEMGSVLVLLKQRIIFWLQHNFSSSHIKKNLSFNSYEMVLPLSFLKSKTYRQTLSRECKDIPVRISMRYLIFCIPHFVVYIIIIIS